jgi:glycosylphosphatidylinositol transamidase (GPIT) subunit GPI8
MDTTLEKLKNYFPILPPNAIVKFYRARCERLRLLMNHRIPEDIRWMIEAKVRLSGESSNSFISYMLGTGKRTFAKKRRAK